MSDQLSAALAFCKKYASEKPKKKRTIYPMGGHSRHGENDKLLWKLQEALDLLNETILAKWQK